MTIMKMSGIPLLSSGEVFCAIRYLRRNMVTMASLIGKKLEMTMFLLQNTAFVQLILFLEATFFSKNNMSEVLFQLIHYVCY